MPGSLKLSRGISNLSLGTFSQEIRKAVGVVCVRRIVEEANTVDVGEQTPISIAGCKPDY